MNRFKPLIYCAAGALLLFAQAAHGSVNLKQVQVSRGDQIDLLFDRDLRAGDLKTEFFRDIIQVSVRNASVYPAKIVSVKGDSISKVFAYQYTPSLIRCRLTVKGDAEKYKDRIKVSVSGRMVTLKVDGAARVSDAIVTGSAHPVTAHALKTAASKPAKDSGVRKDLTETQKSRLLDKVMKGTGEPVREAASEKTGPLGGKSSGPSPMKAFWWLTVMLGLVGAFAYGIKRIRGGKAGSIAARLGISGKIKAFSAKKDFEVISSHHLGPRRSIMLVRVKNRLLVLGVSNESINLITEFDETGDASAAEQVVQNLVTGAAPARAAAPRRPSLSARIAAQMAAEAKGGDAGAAAMAADMSSAMGSGAESAGPAVFAEFLQHEEARAASGTARSPVSVNRFDVPSEASGSGAGVRESIRKRIEGFKSL